MLSFLLTNWGLPFFIRDLHAFGEPEHLPLVHLNGLVSVKFQILNNNLQSQRDPNPQFNFLVR
jgi:hypothetical protein